MEPMHLCRTEVRAGPARHRVRDGAVQVARETVPLLACLMIPATMVLAIAFYAASPEPDEAPAAAVTSSSTVDPWPGYRFEQAGDSAWRLLDDDTGYQPGSYYSGLGEVPDTIAIGTDGHVLACCDTTEPIFGLVDHESVHRLGHREPAALWDDDEVGLGRPHDLAVATDGALWMAGDRIAALVDGTWQMARPRVAGDMVAAGRDGAVWADISNGSLRLARIDGDQTQVFTAGRDLPAMVGDWGSRVTGMATASGKTWVGVAGTGARQPGGLIRFDGRTWRVVRPLGRSVDAHVEGVAAGPDGTLWVYLERSSPRTGARWHADAYLARRDGSAWTVLDESAGVPAHDPAYHRRGQERVLLRVGPSGTVWLTPYDEHGCARLVSYDGATATEHLPPGACVHDLELDAEGRAWVSVDHEPQAGAERSGTDLYLVDATA